MIQPLLSGAVAKVFLFSVSIGLAMGLMNSNALSQPQAEPKENSLPADLLYLNVNAQGELLVAGRKNPLKTEEEIKTYLSKRFADALNAAKANDEADVRTILIIRASQDADFTPVFNLLKEAKLVGFRQWQLRATIAGKAAKEASIAPQYNLHFKEDVTVVAGKAAKEEPVTPVKPATVRAELTVLVKTAREGKTQGEISGMVVRSVEADISIRNVEALSKYLTTKRKDLANQEDISIAADGKLKYGAVIEVMDACLQAGFARVGFLPPPEKDQ